MSLLGLLKYSLGLIPINLDGANPSFEHEIYFLVSNFLFLATSVFLWRNTATSSRFDSCDLVAKRQVTLFVYLALYCLGVALYFRAALESDYYTFVNFEGSAWAQIFFYAGSTSIAIVSARRNWLLAFALCIPYVMLSSVLGIRSLIALSVFPLLMVFMITQRDRINLFDRLPGRPKRTLTLRKPRPRTLLGLALACGALAYSVIGASLYKHDRILLPEENVLEGYFVVTNALELEPELLGTESVERFFWGLGAPVFKQFGIRYERESDPPTIFATYIDEYANRLDQFFHYPSLWQADTFAAFRFAGLLLAPFWAFVLISMETLLRSNPGRWLTFLPVSCWASFMFARGAVGNATISMSYVILILTAISLLLMVFVRRLSRRDRLCASFPTKKASQ
ncbi:MULTISPECIES: hypothetical protein [unclassified Aliiroseovarius]|uniref:hypothetical protein n=1 Tax=unclassified Aliiroseovarius TaxID=2623558 RepID=UPI001568C24E|nr:MULTISPECIES: hypothetical protein [unclassified Aliiroseovarius]